MPSELNSEPSARLVIGIAGRIGSGKTSIGTYLREQHGFQYLRYSLVLAEWKAADPAAKGQLQEVGWEVMATGMQAELNERLIRQVRSSEDAAIDGLRHPDDVTTLKHTFADGFRLVFMEALTETRWQRLKKKYPTRESFEAADSAPVEQHIDSLKSSAAASIVNERSILELYDRVDRLLVEFRKAGVP